MSGKSKDEQMAERKQELEKRLQDVSGQLGSGKKSLKKGKNGLGVIRNSASYFYLFYLNIIY